RRHDPLARLICATALQQAIKPGLKAGLYCFAMRASPKSMHLQLHDALPEQSLPRAMRANAAETDPIARLSRPQVAARRQGDAVIPRVKLHPHNLRPPQNFGGKPGYPQGNPQDMALQDSPLPAG